jgi:hypothetical protein
VWTLGNSPRASTAAAEVSSTTESTGNASAGPRVFPYGFTVTATLVAPPGEHERLPVILRPVRRPLVSTDSTPQPRTCHGIYPPPPSPKNVLRAEGPVARAFMTPHRRHDQVTRSASWSYSECQSCRPSSRHFKRLIALYLTSTNHLVWHSDSRAGRGDIAARRGSLTVTT